MTDIEDYQYMTRMLLTPEEQNPPYDQAVRALGDSVARLDHTYSALSGAAQQVAKTYVDALESACQEVLRRIEVVRKEQAQ